MTKKVGKIGTHFGPHFRCKIEMRFPARDFLRNTSGFGIWPRDDRHTWGPVQQEEFIPVTHPKSKVCNSIVKFTKNQAKILVVVHG